MNFPSVWINYCCNTKTCTKGITWTYNSDRCDLTILQMNLLATESCDGWHLQEKPIKLLKEKYNGQILSAFNEAVSLIPRDIFCISTSSSTLSSVKITSGISMVENSTRIQYGDEEQETIKEKYYSTAGGDVVALCI